MVVEGINLMGRQVRYLDHLSMPQIGTIIDWKPHNTKPEVMILAVINVREKLNEEPYTYMDKISGVTRTIKIDMLVNSDECTLIEEDK